MPNHRLLQQYSVLYSVILIYLLKSNYLRLPIAFTLLILPFIQTLVNNFYNPCSSILSYEKREDFWTDISCRLDKVITRRDTVSAEALGYIAYYMKNNYFHDPIGLTDPHIAMNGTPSITFGKLDRAYTVGVIRPSIMAWHYAGHMRGVEQSLLDNYETFCATNCDSWNANVVMIRHDRLDDLAPAFKDWQKITLSTSSIVKSK